MFTLRKTLKPPTVFTITHRLLTTVKLPSSAAYDDLIYTAGTNRYFAAVRHLLNHRYTNGFFTTNNTFKFISSNLYVLNDVIKTISDLNEAKSRKKAYELLISRLCKLQVIDSALHVAETASAAGKHAADASTFHPILSFVTRKKDFDLAWRVVEVMKANNVARDVTCYNFLLTSYSVAGDLKSTAVVLRIMEGVKADARTYDALVLGACKAANVEGAIGIMRRMVEDDVEALYATYAHVIGSLVKLGYCAQAVEFVVG